jgi:hypothetical protein
MKPLLRVAAALSFGFCFLAGSLILGIALASGYSDALIIAAVGLVLMGIGLFMGAILLVAAERIGRKAEGG